METDGLTPLTYWFPTDATKFKYAAVCHNLDYDWYGIGAVFERNINGTLKDSVYFFYVEGDSTNPNYGQLLAYTRLNTADRIDSVDCTQNDVDSIYVAYDMKSLNARWWKITGYSLFGPYEIARSSGCSSYTHRPRIAFGDPNNPNVLIAYEGYNYPTEFPGCGICTSTYTDSGSFIKSDLFWADNMHHNIYDVEWNGYSDGLFIVVIPYDLDQGPPRLGYIQYDYDGDKIAEGVIQDFWDEPTPPYPGVVKIVNTYYHYNTTHRFIVQTDKASTYWLNSLGQTMIYDYNPRYDYGGTYGDKFAVCEYWGTTADRIAHTYNAHVQLLPRPTYNTVHWQWDRTPYSDDPHETYYINGGYYPEACNAADTNDDYNEVLLVSRKNVSPPDYRIYWNIEPQN